jgi:hypothetical protein
MPFDPPIVRLRLTETAEVLEKVIADTGKAVEALRALPGDRYLSLAVTDLQSANNWLGRFMAENSDTLVEKGNPDGTPKPSR